MSMTNVIACAEGSVVRGESARGFVRLARAIATFAANWREAIDEARALERAARARHPYFTEW